LLRRHLEQFEARHSLLDGGVVNCLGMQLALDVIAQAHFLHGLDVARTGSECDAVEDMDNFIALRRRGRRLVLGLGRPKGEKGEKARDHRQNRSEQDNPEMSHTISIRLERMVKVTLIREKASCSLLGNEGKL